MKLIDQYDRHEWYQILAESLQVIGERDRVHYTEAAEVRVVTTSRMGLRQSMVLIGTRWSDAKSYAEQRMEQHKC